DSPWNIRPVGPVFGAYTLPAGQYKPSVDKGPYSTSAFLAAETDLPMVVTLVSSNGSATDPDARTIATSVTIPRWPAATQPASGSDGHAEIVDPISGKVHSFWQLRLVDGKWRAALHAWSPLDGRGWGDPAHYYQGARATGVSTLGGLIRIHEVDDGKSLYQHALAMSLPKEGLRANPAYVYPATSADTGAANENTGEIPEGALMMLPPNYTMTYNNPLIQKVVETLKVYGARVVDRNVGTPFSIYVENGARWPIWVNNPGADNAMYAEMDNIRKALREVISANSYVDGNGNPTTADKPGNFNILSMRGPWSVVGTGGGTPAPYNSLTQSIEFSSRPTALEQANGNGTGIAGGSAAQGGVSWGRPVAGDKFLLTAIGTGGAQIRLAVYGTNPNGSQYFAQTNYLSNGQSTVVTWPAGGWATVYARIGANQSGSIRATMVKQ
ncbi:MAG: Atrophin-1 multi-domain protein, partial [Duganella sp.]